MNDFMNDIDEMKRKHPSRFMAYLVVFATVWGGTSAITAALVTHLIGIIGM